jgi:chromosome segregation ATPase
LGTRHPDTAIEGSSPAIRQASVSEAISRLQREKECIQRELDRKREITTIKSLHKELGDDDAEFEDDDDDPLVRRIRRECKKRVKECEERLQQVSSDRHRQAMLLDKADKDLKDARDEAADAQRGAITMYNEQKCYELHIQRLQSDVHRANSAVEKMRTEAVGLTVKIQELRNERTNRQRLFDGET